jgi:NAD(P)-dependent dehydrogenase (short-subunit alcohol dehydrogenase family)
MTGFVERQPYHALGACALVIGCGDMGMGCARALGKRHPLLIADRDAERLSRSVDALCAEGFVARGIACDIVDADDVSRLAEELGRGSGVRVLAHVAAVGNAPGGWREVMNIDLVGAHRIANAVAPHMVRGGAAVLISSTGSQRSRRSPELDGLLDNPFRLDFEDALIRALGGEPDFLEAYFMAKRGVNRLARKLAIDWGDREVRAVSISPGLIDSTMGRTGGTALPVYDGGEMRLGSRAEKAALEVPLRRQGSLLEVVAVVDFVASDAASFLNGIDIPVDGGSTAFWRSLGGIER